MIVSQIVYINHSNALIFCNYMNNLLVCMIFYKNNMTSISYSPMDDSIIFYVKYVLSKQQVKFLNPFDRKYSN